MSRSQIAAQEAVDRESEDARTPSSSYGKGVSGLSSLDRGRHPQPLSPSERGLRPSEQYADTAESVLQVPVPDESSLPLDSASEEVIQAGEFRRRRHPELSRGIEIELQPMGSQQAAALASEQQAGDEWEFQAICGTPEESAAIELQQLGGRGDPGHSIAPGPATADQGVMSAQANFMRICVPQPSALSTAEPAVGCPEDFSEAALWGPAGGQTVELLCTVRALLKKMRQRVHVGDFVSVINIDWVSRQGMVADTLPRRSKLSNPPVANVDQVLLVFSLDRPPWDGQMATRFLVSAEAADLPVTVVLNKADLVSEERKQEILQLVESWGYSAICVSASSGLGLEALARTLALKVSVTAGPSGVGKSSVINALNATLKHQQHQESEGVDTVDKNIAACPPGQAAYCGEENPSAADLTRGEQAIGDVSQIGRGRHTTRTVTLLPVAGGLLADTPGFNQPALEGVQPEELPAYFPEILDRADSCKFGNCQHMDDEGCAVREGWLRHEWYAELRKELEQAAAIARERATSKKRREGNVKYKSKGSSRTREVLLDPKKHRNVSRRQRKQSIMEVLAEAEDEDQ